MMRTKRKYNWLAAVCLAAMLLTGCGKSAAGDTTAETASGEKYQRQVYAMDTIMMLTAYGSQAESALAEAEQEIYTLEDDLDPENPDGSVYALNANTGSQVVVTPDCYSVMETTMHYYYLSGGALDPGLYPIIKAWGFTTETYRVPTQTELNSLLSAKLTGSIALDESVCAATIPVGMEVSFGAVGKGYTAQKVMDLLAEDGVESAILSLGGNVQTLGDTKPDGSQWQVAVTDPNDTGSYVGILSLGQAAVVTSGGYQRYFEQDGVTYIHIIDPATGYPVDNDLLSVTVVTDDGAKADALSTTLFVMGKEKALAFQQEQGDFELVLITTDNQVIVTAGLVDCFAERGEGYTYEYLS
jgi:thiamine biosynthesis lipoprotein